jgi:hypothetical protein
MRWSIANFKNGANGNFARQLTSDLHEVPPSKAVTVALHDRNKTRGRISNAMNMG